MAAVARAREFYLAEDQVKAKEELRRAVALAPDWSEGHLQLGKLLFNLCAVRFSTAVFDRACLDQAVAELERARALDPKSAEAAYWMGRALGKVPRIPEAMARLEDAIAIDPRHGLALKELGLLCAQQGDALRAKEYLLRAREVLPNDADVLFQLGMLFESEEDMDQAKSVFLRAVELNPAHPGPLTALVRIYRRQGDEQAAKVTEDALASCKEFGKRLTQAQQRFEATHDSASCLDIARLYQERGMVASAREWAERAGRIDPKNAGAVELLKKLGGADAKKPAQSTDESERP